MNGAHPSEQPGKVALVDVRAAGGHRRECTRRCGTSVVADPHQGQQGDAELGGLAGRRLQADGVQRAQLTAPGPLGHGGAGQGGDSGSVLPSTPARAAAPHSPFPAAGYADPPGRGPACSTGSCTPSPSIAAEATIGSSCTPQPMTIARSTPTPSYWTVGCRRAGAVLHPLRRPADRAPDRSGRALRLLRPAVGRSPPPLLGGCRRLRRHPGGHRAADRHRPPPDRVHRLAGGIRGRRRPVERLVAGAARGRTAPGACRGTNDFPSGAVAATECSAATTSPPSSVSRIRWASARCLRTRRRSRRRIRFRHRRIRQHRRREAAGLSSLSQPLRQVAENCLRIVFDQIQHTGDHPAPEHVLLAPTLELRGSTGHHG